MSSLMMARSKGNKRLVGIPVFTTRLFFPHDHARRPRRKGFLDRPADLKVDAVPQTAALWARGVMQHEFGVAPTDMEHLDRRTVSRRRGPGPAPGHELTSDTTRTCAR